MSKLKEIKNKIREKELKIMADQATAQAEIEKLNPKTLSMIKRGIVCVVIGILMTIIALTRG